MLRKSSGMAKILQKLPAAPGLSEIHHFLSQAMERRGRQVVVTWFTPDKLVEFSLEIQCPIKGGDTEWKLFSGKDRDRKLLWEYKTCDVLLVYNLIVSSSGEVHHAVQIDGAISVSESFRDQSRKRDTYYMQAMQTHEVDIARLSQLGLKDNSWSRGTAEHTGDLSLVQISSLLQSLLIAKMTGCLEINKNNEKAKVFFVDGEPTYAEIGKLVGDECILEIVTWREGKYEFLQRQRTDQKNVRNSLESLVLQGVKLKDQVNYLKNAGLRPESILQHKYPNISQAEFDARTSTGAPVALQVLKSIYITIDAENNLKQIATKLQLPQSIWVPAIVHMLESDLITFTNEQSKVESNESLIPKSIDPTFIHSVMMSLRRAETGMFTYPAFLYFLEQEYFRGYRSGSPLSVMIMEMRVIKGPPDFKREPLDVVAVAEVFRRISQLKRHIDLVAHYETYDYAMILPNTKSSGANVFAQRIVNALLSSPLPGGVHAGKLSLSFGVACIPEDCTDLSYVLAAAEAAKAQAILLAAPVILFRDIKAGAD
jgi:GGDEF domain-containing protein